MKCPLPVVAIQRDHRVAAAREALASRAVDDQRVEVPIVVVVEERGAVAIGVNDEVLGGASGDVEEIEARLGGDIHEPDRGALRPRRADPERCDQGGRAEPGDRWHRGTSGRSAKLGPTSGSLCVVPPP